MEKAAGEQLKKTDAIQRENAALKSADKAAELKKLQAEKDAVSAKLASTEKELADAKKAVTALEAKVKDLEAKSKSAAAAAVKTVGAPAPAQTAELQQLTKQLEETKAKLSAAEKAIAAAKTAKPAEVKVPTADPAQAAKISDLTKQLEETKAKLASTEKALSDAGKTMNTIAAGASAKESEQVKKLKSDNEALNATIQSLTADKTTSGEALIAAKKELLAAKAQLEKLRAEVAADETAKRLQENLTKAEENITQLKGSNQTLQKSLDSTAADNKSLKEKNDALTRELETVRKHTAAVQAEIRKLSAGGDAVLNSKLEEKDKVIDKLLKEHVTQDQEIDRLKAEISDANALVAANDKQIKALQQTVDKLKEERKNITASRTTIVTTGVRLTRDGKVKLDQTPVTEKPAETVEEKAARGAELLKKEEEAKTVWKRTIILTEDEQKKYDAAMADAAAREKAGELDEAMWKYLTASDLDKEAWQPHMAMARIFLKGGKADKARKEYARALMLNMERNEAFEAEMSKMESDNAAKAEAKKLQDK